jgi:hypothetical protein
MLDPTTQGRSEVVVLGTKEEGGWGGQGHSGGQPRQEQRLAWWRRGARLVSEGGGKRHGGVTSALPEEGRVREGDERCG